MMMNLAAFEQVNRLENRDRKSFFLTFCENWIDEIGGRCELDTLNDITRELFEKRSSIMEQAALALIEKRCGDLLDQEYCQCPICQKKIKAKTEKVKREVKTMIGSIVLYRPYFYCSGCRHGFYPFDEALGLSDRKIQHDVQEVETFLAANMPFEEASETMERCAGIQVSDHHIHDITNEIASDLAVLDVSPTKDDIHQKIEALSANKFRRPVLMIGIDGAHAPTRPEPSERSGPRGKGQWREVKGFRIYLLDGKRIIHLISWHQIKSDKELASDLLEIKNAGLIPEDQVRICAIGDGAAWIWNRVDEIYPKAKKVLDYYHCSQYLHDLANAQYGKESQKAREWVEVKLTQLFVNEVDEVITEIAEMEPNSDSAKEIIEKTRNYLYERRKMISYGSIKRGGYHIGSGGIESSNKFISNVRLKRSGAWWYPTNANNILKLRCAKYNGTFDRVMQEKVYKKPRKKSGGEKSALHIVVNNS